VHYDVTDKTVASFLNVLTYITVVILHI